MDTQYPGASVAGSAAGRRVKALQLLAGLVLAGLWLMHGVSATTEAGCHGVPVLMTSMSAPAAHAGPAAAGLARTSAATVSQPGTAGSTHAGEGETCLSGQPPSSGDLLLGLLACLAAFAFACGLAEFLPRRPSSTVDRLRRRGPPGPVGRALLTSVCISRT